MQTVAEHGIPGVCEPTLDGIGETAKDGRPSLEVALENLTHIIERVNPFVGRLRAWDLRGLDSELSIRFQGSVEDLAASCARLNDQLVIMNAMGFVAKTTPATRLRAKLAPGCPVRLTGKALTEFSELFTPDQLASIHCLRTTPTSAFLATKDGTQLGLVKLSCIEVVE
jgi:hypothetical protein